MAIVGGVGTLFGGVVGAGAHHRAGERRQLLHRALADGARPAVRADMIFAPEGIVGKARRCWRGAECARRVGPKACGMMQRTVKRPSQYSQETIMDRRKFVASTAALSGLGRMSARSPAAAQGTGPIKIGLLAPLTGVVAAGGKEIQ